MVGMGGDLKGAKLGQSNAVALAQSPLHVSGRKCEVVDCQWLQQLMSYGLLRGAFRSGEGVCVLRAVTRQRHTQLRTQPRYLQAPRSPAAKCSAAKPNTVPIGPRKP